MTKKEELVWRLGRLPSVEEITTLIDKKIITQEEAREILFNKKIEEERDVKSLEMEIKFLRDLVEKLSQNRSQIVEIIKEIKVPYYQYHWYQPYQLWCSSGNVQCGSSLGMQQNTVTNAINGIANTLSNFSSIQTW
jgi:hypothetical protein